MNAKNEASDSRILWGGALIINQPISTGFLDPQQPRRDLWKPWTIFEARGNYKSVGLNAQTSWKKPHKVVTTWVRTPDHLYDHLTNSGPEASWSVRMIQDSWPVSWTWLLRLRQVLVRGLRHLRDLCKERHIHRESQKHKIIFWHLLRKGEYHESSRQII